MSCLVCLSCLHFRVDTVSGPCLSVVIYLSTNSTSTSTANERTNRCEMQRESGENPFVFAFGFPWLSLFSFLFAFSFFLDQDGTAYEQVIRTTVIVSRHTLCMHGTHAR